jgi:hypothetical protein
VEGRVGFGVRSGPRGKREIAAAAVVVVVVGGGGFVSPLPFLICALLGTNAAGFVAPASAMTLSTIIPSPVSSLAPPLPTAAPTSFSPFNNPSLPAPFTPLIPPAAEEPPLLLFDGGKTENNPPPPPASARPRFHATGSSVSFAGLGRSTVICFLEGLDGGGGRVAWWGLGAGGGECGAWWSESESEAESEAESEE